MLLVALLVFRAPRGVLSGRAAGCARGLRPASLMVLLVAPRVFRAPEGPAAREARRPHFARRVASKPGQAPPPPTGTAARPSGPSGALHTSGAWSLMHGSVHRLEVRPGPAAAHRHRGRSLRRPSHQWGLVADVARCVVSKPGRALPSPINFARNSPVTCSNIEFATLELQCFGVVWCVLLQTSSIQGVFRVDFCPVVTNVVNPSAFSVKMLVFGLRLTTFVTEVLARRFELRWFDDVCNVGRPLVARPGLAAAHGHHRLALSASWAGCLKPLSPLRVPAEPRLKPSSPLRVRNGCIWCIFRLQWCCRFQWSLFGGEQWCRRFHTGLHQWLQRCYWFQSWHVAVSCARKSSPSARKMAQISVFWRAGRVFSRECRWRGCAVRVFSRKSRWWGCAGVRQRGGTP